MQQRPKSMNRQVVDGQAIAHPSLYPYIALNGLFPTSRHRKKSHRIWANCNSDLWRSGEQLVHLLHISYAPGIGDS